MKISVAPGALSNSGTWVNVSGTSTGHVALGTSGNVGVGTTTPTEKLEVQGSIKIIDGNQGSGKVLISDASGKGTWQEMPGDLPYGTIMAFNGESCPVGWVIADGTGGTPDLRGEFIRGLDSGRGVDGGRTLGSFQSGTYTSQKITDWISGTDTTLTTVGYGLGQAYASADSEQNSNIIPAGAKTSVGGNFPANYVDNVALGGQDHDVDTSFAGKWISYRPRNVALLYCMKISVAPASVSNSATWMNIDGTSSGRVVLATTGNVGIGTSAPTNKFETIGGNFSLTDGGVINTSAVQLYSLGGNLNIQNGGGNNTYFRSKAGAITVTVNNSGSISTADSIYAGAFYYSSDINLKKNLKKITGALDKIQKIQGYVFDWKKDGTPDIGIIAQDVEQVFPELVEEREDSNTGEKYKTVKYANLVAPIIEAIRELAQEVKSLYSITEKQSERIDTLERENIELKKRLDAIEAKLGITHK